MYTEKSDGSVLALSPQKVQRMCDIEYETPKKNLKLDMLQPIPDINANYKNVNALRGGLNSIKKSKNKILS